MYLSVPRGTIDNPLSAHALWAALWPMLAGGAALLALERWGRGRLPRVPEGDIAVAIDAAARAAVPLGERVVRADAILRQWPTAGLALAAVALAFGAMLTMAATR
jgi:hypothetical protein